MRSSKQSYARGHRAKGKQQDNTKEFEKHYNSVYGSRWPSLRDALLRPTLHAAVANAFISDASAAACSTAGLAPLLTAGPYRAFRLRGKAAGPYPPPPLDPSSALRTWYWLDLASLLPVLLLQPRRGHAVLDMCAAPGGKSVLIAQRLFTSQYQPPERPVPPLIGSSTASEAKAEGQAEGEAAGEDVLGGTQQVELLQSGPGTVDLGGAATESQPGPATTTTTTTMTTMTARATAPGTATTAPAAAVAEECGGRIEGSQNGEAETAARDAGPAEGNEPAAASLGGDQGESSGPSTSGASSAHPHSSPPLLAALPPPHSPLPLPLPAPPSRLVCNEADRSRLQRLQKVLEEYLPLSARGAVEVLNHPGHTYWARNQANSYDRVLVDAPCSSDRHVLQQAAAATRGVIGAADWSLGACRRIADEQLQLCLAGMRALRLGGRLVYSTCSTSPLQNDDLMDRLLRRCGPSAARLVPPLELLHRAVQELEEGPAEAAAAAGAAAAACFGSGQGSGQGGSGPGEEGVADATGARVGAPEATEATRGPAGCGARPAAVEQAFGVEATRLGAICLPDRGGWGPIYVAVVEKVGEVGGMGAASVMRPVGLGEEEEESEEDEGAEEPEQEA